MSDVRGVGNVRGPDLSSAKTIALVIYILYLVSLAAWITSLVGVVMAYVQDAKFNTVGRTDDRHWIRSHFRFQIRTFWIFLLYLLIAVPVLAIAFGRDGVGAVALGYIVLLIWYAIRCAKGMMSLSKREEHPNPTTWLFG